MKDEMDDTCLVLKTGMQASNIKWNSNGSVLAVSGVMGNTGPAAALVQFYSYSGRCSASAASATAAYPHSYSSAPLTHCLHLFTHHLICLHIYCLVQSHECIESSSVTSSYVFTYTGLSSLMNALRALQSQASIYLHIYWLVQSHECIESKLQLHLQVHSPVVPKTMLHNLCRCCLTSVSTLPSQKCCYCTAPSRHNAAYFPMQDSTCALCECQALGSMLWHGRREASGLPWQ